MKGEILPNMEGLLEGEYICRRHGTTVSHNIAKIE
jgi:hypothetical protein